MEGDEEGFGGAGKKPRRNQIQRSLMGDDREERIWQHGHWSWRSLCEPSWKAGITKHRDADTKRTLFPCAAHTIAVLSKAGSLLMIPARKGVWVSVLIFVSRPAICLSKLSMMMASMRAFLVYVCAWVRECICLGLLLTHHSYLSFS